MVNECSDALTARSNCSEDQIRVQDSHVGSSGSSVGPLRHQSETGAHVNRVQSYTVIDPGGIGRGQVLVRVVELHMGHEPRRVLHGLFVR